MWKIPGCANWPWECNRIVVSFRYAPGRGVKTDEHKLHDAVLRHRNQERRLQKTFEDHIARTFTKQMIF